MKKPLTAKPARPPVVSRGGGKKKDVTIVGSDEPIDVSVDPKHFDSSTNAIMTVSYSHHEIHSGSHFFYDDVHDLARNASVSHLIVTPDTAKWAHLVFSIGANGGQIEVEVFEAPTVSELGIIEPMFNRNRNYPDTPTTLLYEEPVVTDEGIRIDHAKYGTTDKKSIGGGDRGSSEIVLRQNTMYLFKIVELNVADSVVNVTFDWYEHTNKN